MRQLLTALSLSIAVLLPGSANAAEAAQEQGTSVVLAGPINARLPAAGEAIRKDFPAPLAADSPWTIKSWVRIDERSPRARPVAALVDDTGAVVLEFGLIDAKIYASAGGRKVMSPAVGRPGDWILVTLSSSGAAIELSVGKGPPARAAMRMAAPATALILAPRGSEAAPYAGALANLAIWRGAAGSGPSLAWSRPDDELIQFENGSPTWPLQVKQFMGMTSPQDAATLPVSRSDAVPVAPGVHAKLSEPLAAAGAGRWKIGAWRFVAAPDTTATAEAVSSPGFGDRAWLPATVPGTILTSYVDNGVYPDPAYGLNNLVIPEKLNRQDYWFRSEIVVPASASGQRLSLGFEGINYAAEVWVDGQRLGAITGAFTRGRFALPASVRPGQKLAIGVRISPPPHPSLPHEESLAAGPGQNGGAMAVDGPTFAASQGWDWIPSVRDRNTGIWQDVVLEATGAVRIGDPQVRTVLPKSDNSVAELTIEVPVANDSDAAATVKVEARFDGIVLDQVIEAAPHTTTNARFSPDRFAALRISHPDLWWPNGYGKPTLHPLALSASIDGAVSDSRHIRFGIREISYELSLVDAREALQRVSFAPARSHGEPLLAVDHDHIRKVAGGWALSLAEEIGKSPALVAAPPTTLAPHLLIRVNGVPIAVRGGNWGMDDWRKRVSRERLEPYFRLHREANANTIRNWLGQNTEEAFFDLADEYGLLVLSDFWLSSQDFNGEPGDSALFLANAADTISRYRHHPSIALWIGRNEGVPPPVLNTGLDRLVRELDGTRAYLPNSRSVQMANSGPWLYQQPETYFSKHAQGFSTEVGTPSIPTLEAFKAMMPAADQWPISDAWAYHDWHQAKAGDVAPFMKELAARFGPATDLADFVRKAQMLNYESHRAIFEGMNDGLFTRNSGRLLWMTHPAWPSTEWQIYSHDYDTQASYYGFKAGTEPIHVQINLPGMAAAVVNSLATPLAKAKVRMRNFDLAGNLLDERTALVDAAPFATTAAGPAVPAALLAANPVVLTRLELSAADGALLSRNTYWQARDAASYRALTRMKKATLSVQVEPAPDAQENELRVSIANDGAVPALMAKLSLIDASGARILPAYWSDNYVSLLPGERRTLTVKSPKSGNSPEAITLEGWNVEPIATRIVQ